MSKRLILLLVAVYFFSYFNLAWADVIINEVQIGGINANDEFVELYNSSSLTIDLTNWYLNKKSSTGSESALVAKSRLKNKIIPPNSYFLLGKENGYMGNVIPDIFWPNSYDLANSNSLILYGEDDTRKDEINWEAIENGKSIQKTNSGWVVAIPTPKTANENISTPETTSNQNVSVLDISPILSATESKTKITEEPKIKTKITAKTLGFVGLPLSFQATTFGYSGEELRYGKYFWNFGDASSKEAKLSDNSSFTHTYFYPGEYTVSLDYYLNYYSNASDVSETMVVKIVSPDISISRVGDEKDFFVELFNHTDYSADISNWTLRSSQKSFTMPQNTILASKKKMIISPKITNFSITDKNTLQLLASQGEIVFDYVPSVVPIIPVKIISTSIPQGQSPREFPQEPSSSSDVVFTSTPEDLLARVVSSNITNNNKTGKSNTIIIFVTFLAFIGISASTVYFIRRKRTISVSGNDFEILDE